MLTEDQAKIVFAIRAIVASQARTEAMVKEFVRAYKEDQMVSQAKGDEMLNVVRQLADANQAMRAQLILNNDALQVALNQAKEKADVEGDDEVAQAFDVIQSELQKQREAIPRQVEAVTENTPAEPPVSAPPVAPAPEAPTGTTDDAIGANVEQSPAPQQQ